MKPPPPVLGGLISLAAGLIVVATTLRKKPRSQPAGEDKPLSEWTTSEVCSLLESIEVCLEVIQPKLVGTSFQTVVINSLGRASWPT